MQFIKPNKTIDIWIHSYRRYSFHLSIEKRLLKGCNFTFWSSRIRLLIQRWGRIHILWSSLKRSAIRVSKGFNSINRSFRGDHTLLRWGLPKEINSIITSIWDTYSVLELIEIEPFLYIWFVGGKYWIDKKKRIQFSKPFKINILNREQIVRLDNFRV